MQRNESLRRERVARNWRQQDVADQLDTTVTTIQRWERGSQHPSAYYCTKLCTLFGKSARELGLLEPAEGTTSDREQTVSAFAEKNALWMVPYLRNPHFTGRNDLLNHLQRQFARSSAEQPTTIQQAALTQSQAIKGLGGIGKTQTAIEYAYRAREQGRYTHTLWINAASEEAVLSGFTALKDWLPLFGQEEESDQRVLTNKALRWLEQCPDPWLLIYDNADDIAFLPVYLPKEGQGSILFTTRTSAITALAESLEVDALPLEDAIRLLLRRAGRERDATAQEREEVAAIVLALGQFPLAIDQAGAYIEETGCGFADYLQIYQQHQYELLARRGKQASGYPDSVATTWSLAFELIEKHHPAATELLQVCAFVAPDQIPEELLTEGAPYWPAALQEAVKDRPRFNQLLSTLLAFSLIKRVGRERQLNIHRLVQLVQQARMTPEEQSQWAERLVLAVQAVFPRETEQIADWQVCQRLLQQVLACETLIEQHQFQFAEAADLLDRAGSYLSNRGLYRLTEPLLRRALEMRQQLLGSDHPDVASSLHNLGLLYWQLGAYARAASLYEHALRIFEQHLGPEQPDIVSILNDLALLYNDQGKYAQAEPLFQRALRISEQYLGPEHPAVAYALYGLATLCWKLGKYAQAEPLFQRALHIFELSRGLEHPVVASTLVCLASLSYNQGQYTQVEQLYQQALRIYEQQLGSEDKYVAYALYGLATFYWKLGKPAQAEPLFQRALHIYELHVEPEHSFVADIVIGLVRLSYDQGQYAQAEQLCQRALHICEQKLGPEHPNTAYPLHRLALITARLGNDEESERLEQRALQIWEERLGPEHPSVAYALHGLALLYTQMGREDEAEAMFRQALHIREQTMEETHLDLAEVQHDFASFLHGQGQIQEAAVLYQRALTTREHVLGLDHPLTLGTRTRLQAVLLQLQKQEKHATESSSEEDLVPACPQCQQTNEVLKSGKNRSGSQRFRCRTCQLYFTPQSGAKQPDPAHKALALALAEQGMSYRQIARELGVHHQTVSGWIDSHGTHRAE